MEFRDITEKDFATLASVNGFQEVVISTSIVSLGWALRVKRLGASDYEYLQTARGERRRFKTLDAAASFMRKNKVSDWSVCDLTWEVESE